MTKRLSKDEIKKQLIESIIINNAVEIDHLNKLDEKVQKPEDAAIIIKQYEEIHHTKERASYLYLIIKASFSND